MARLPVPVTERGYTTLTQSKSWWALDEGETTPELIWPLNLPIYDLMRRSDPQIISVLRAVKLPIRRTKWWISANGASPEVTQFCADELGLQIQGQEPRPVLRTRDRFSWGDHLRHALLMLDFGSSYFEQVYRIANGQAHLRKLGWRPPQSIAAYNVADDGGLDSIQQHGVEKPIPIGNLVAYVNEREGANWAGMSLLRPAYKPWLLKDRALRTQSITGERNGLGVPVYMGPKFPETLTAAEYERMSNADLQAGQNLASSVRAGDDSGAAIANGGDFKLVGVSGTLPDLDVPIRYHDEQIARAVLAHFLNLGTQTGSWALGSTFADFFTMSLQTVAQDIAAITSAHVIEDLVDVNFGTDVPAPIVTFDEIGSTHPATAEAIKLLVDAGVITADDELETYLRNQLTLPAHDPTTARERPAPAPATTAPAPQQAPATKGFQ